MTHYYEKNIVDIKNEYVECLTNIITPLIYEGIQTIYVHSKNLYEKLEEQCQLSETTNDHNIMSIFKQCLRDVQTLSSPAIETEVQRIRTYSKCADIFDDLIKAVFKSYIVLLTYNASGKTCKLVTEKYHEKININDFIHKCYIECANIFFDDPELFWDGHTNDILQHCKTLSYKYIKKAIINSIRKSIPLKQILSEYLSNDYIKKDTATIDTRHIFENDSSVSHSRTVVSNNDGGIQNGYEIIRNISEDEKKINEIINNDENIKNNDGHVDGINNPDITKKEYDTISNIVDKNLHSDVKNNVHDNAENNIIPKVSLTDKQIDEYFNNFMDPNTK